MFLKINFENLFLFSAQSAYFLQRADLDYFVKLFFIVGIAKRYILLDARGEHPGLLRDIEYFALHVNNARRCLQLAKQGQKQWTLRIIEFKLINYMNISIAHLLLFLMPQGHKLLTIRLKCDFFI